MFINILLTPISVNKHIISVLVITYCCNVNLYRKISAFIFGWIYAPRVFRSLEFDFLLLPVDVYRDMCLTYKAINGHYTPRVFLLYNLAVRLYWAQDTTPINKGLLQGP